MTINYGKLALKEMIENAGKAIVDDMLVAPPGTSKKVCHVTCPAGVDTRSRMTITNSGGQSLMWHCFNCGESGYYRSRELSYLADPHSHRNTTVVFRDPVKEYLDNLVAKNDLPTWPRLWLAEYDMLNMPYLTGWNKDLLMLPIYNSKSVLTGFQGRNFGTTYGAKYYTAIQKDEPRMAFFRSSLTSRIVGAETIIFTEDVLSAIKIAMIGIDSCALLGTSLCKVEDLPAPETALLHRLHNRAIIWLDPDSAGTKGAMSLVRDLSPIYKINEVRVDEEPKRIPFETLRKIVTTYV
jgi:hypothetical protein